MKNKLLKIGYYVFLGLLGVVALTVTTSALPISGGIKIMAVLSGSMEPAIRTGSVVIVRSHGAYHIGDVITFKGTGPKNVSITHRVVEMRVDRGVPSYVTKGDANNAPDSRLIAQKEIIGSVIVSVPYFGYVVETARKPYGFAALILIPAFVLILDQVSKILREVKRLRLVKQSESTVIEQRSTDSKP